MLAANFAFCNLGVSTARVCALHALHCSTGKGARLALDCHPVSMFRRSLEVWTIEGPNNAHWVLCGFACLREALDVLDAAGVADVSKAELTPGTADCMYCAGCGYAIYTASACQVHRGACPEWSWRSATVLTKQFMDAWVEDFSELPDDDVWVMADELASRAPQLTAEQLVAVVVGLMD